MKKYIFIVLIGLTSLGVMAQNHQGHNPYQGNPGNVPAQYTNPNEAYNNGYREGYRDGQRDAQRDAQKNSHHDSHYGQPNGQHNGQYGDPHHHQPAPTPAPVPVKVANAEQLQFALQVIGKQSYDDKRMEVAKLCVVLCPFPVRDLERMANCFTMEDRKVDFLIYAHKYCPDKENYYQLRHCLRYNSDYDKLMQAVDPTYRR